jgi:uncharacterized protein (DUF1778 family)
METSVKQERINLRTTSEIKKTLSRAAAHRGTSVSAFLLDAAQQQARKILEEEESVVLSPKDWTTFSSILDDNIKPRPKLSSAMQKHFNRKA